MAGFFFQDMKLRTLRSTLPSVPSKLRVAPTPSGARMRGRALQARRWRIWSLNPCCAVCGRVTAFPGGFELDHRVPLHAGGPDTDENCQVLCVHFDAAGEKVGCHAEKTRADGSGEALGPAQGPARGARRAGGWVESSGPPRPGNRAPSQSQIFSPLTGSVKWLR